MSDAAGRHRALRHVRLELLECRALCGLQLGPSSVELISVDGHSSTRARYEEFTTAPENAARDTKRATRNWLAGLIKKISGVLVQCHIVDYPAQEEDRAEDDDKIDGGICSKFEASCK